MKNIFTFFKVLLVLLVVISCSEEEDGGNGSQGDRNLIVYKNQTGDPMADALLAEYKDDGDTYKMNFYGKFTPGGDPLSVSTVTYQKKDNDTIVHLVMEPVSQKLASSYVTVNGAKSNIVTRYDYIDDSPNSIAVSFYDYNWASGSSELIFSNRLDNENGVMSENPVYAQRGAMETSTSGSDWATGILAGIAVAETVAYYQGGASLMTVLSTVSGGAAAVLSSAIAVSIITGVAIGVAIITISAILNPAHASELEPGSNGYPNNGTQVNNPVNPDPTSNLPTPVCLSSSITFSASMDAEGTIMLWGVNGGSGDYSYLVGSSYQQSQVFSNSYQDGAYLVAVRDSNGCITAKTVNLSRDLNNAIEGWYVGTYTLSNPVDMNNNNPYNYTGSQQPIYIYKYFEAATNRWRSICYFPQPAISFYSTITARNTIVFEDGSNGAIITYPVFANMIGETDCANAQEGIPEFRVNLNLGSMRFTNNVSVSTNDQTPGAYRIWGKYHHYDTDTCHDIDVTYQVRLHADYSGSQRPEGMTEDEYWRIMRMLDNPEGFDMEW